MGKLTIPTGPCSIAMLDYQRVSSHQIPWNHHFAMVFIWFSLFFGRFGPVIAIPSWKMKDSPVDAEDFVWTWRGKHVQNGGKLGPFMLWTYVVLVFMLIFNVWNPWLWYSFCRDMVNSWLGRGGWVLFLAWFFGVSGHVVSIKTLPSVRHGYVDNTIFFDLLVRRLRIHRGRSLQEPITQCRIPHCAVRKQKKTLLIAETSKTRRNHVSWTCWLQWKSL